MLDKIMKYIVCYILNLRLEIEGTLFILWYVFFSSLVDIFFLTITE